MRQSVLRGSRSALPGRAVGVVSPGRENAHRSGRHLGLARERQRGLDLAETHGDEQEQTAQTVQHTSEGKGGTQASL